MTIGPFRILLPSFSKFLLYFHCDYVTFFAMKKGSALVNILMAVSLSLFVTAYVTNIATQQADYRGSIGVGGAPPTASKLSTLNTLEVDNKNLQIQLQLNSQLREYTALVTNAMKSIYDKSNNIEATVKTMQRKRSEIVELLKKISPEKIAQLEPSWQAYDQLLIDYSKALKNNNKEQKESIQIKLNQQMKSLASSLSPLNTGVSEEELANLFQIQTTLLTKMIEEYDKKDYENSYKFVDAAYDNSVKIAQALSIIIEITPSPSP